jgi:hypothetical protein
MIRPKNRPILSPHEVLRDSPQFLDRFREGVVETPEIPVQEPCPLDLIIEVEPPDRREEPERQDLVVGERIVNQFLGPAVGQVEILHPVDVEPERPCLL